MTLLNLDNASDQATQIFHPVSLGNRGALSEEDFKRVLALERKRTERSKEPFLLMLLETSSQRSSAKNRNALESMISTLMPTIRDIDFIGWYKEGTTVGVIYTGIGDLHKNSVLSTIRNRVIARLKDSFAHDQFSISFHFFPDDWDNDNSDRPNNPVLYPDLSDFESRRRSVLVMKRVMDVVGSATLLLLCSPLLLIIALVVKASSPGPALFRQQRVSQYGRYFTFLKFRSMRIDNDQSIHKEFVTRFIANNVEPQPSSEDGSGIYKLTKDVRVTRVGEFLRRTSLDELPQLLNVLKGDMSLVGPRPAIPYELAVYQTWHRRRLLEAKPGITGLWQVMGRSRVKFDEMVRLDLQYSSSWTPWLDLKILMLTPLAVIRGAGAV